VTSQLGTGKPLTSFYRTDLNTYPSTIITSTLTPTTPLLTPISSTPNPFFISLRGCMFKKHPASLHQQFPQHNTSYACTHPIPTPQRSSPPQPPLRRSSQLQPAQPSTCQKFTGVGCYETPSPLQQQSPSPPLLNILLINNQLLPLNTNPSTPFPNKKVQIPLDAFSQHPSLNILYTLSS
jgi:hypothetical protein